MMGSKAAADAIAARFLNAQTSLAETFSSPPTASLPNSVSRATVCLVYHPSGVLDIAMSRIRRDELDYPVRILIDPLDVPSRSDLLYRWYDATRDLVEAHVYLDTNTTARLIATRIELDGQNYAGVPLDVVEYVVRVHFGDVVSTLGA